MIQPLKFPKKVGFKPSHSGVGWGKVCERLSVWVVVERG